MDEHSAKLRVSRKSFQAAELAFAQACGWRAPGSPREVVETAQASAEKHLNGFRLALNRSALGWLKSHPVDDCSCDGNTITLAIELYLAEDDKEATGSLALPFDGALWLTAMSPFWKSTSAIGLGGFSLETWCEAVKTLWLKAYHAGLEELNNDWYAEIFRTFQGSELAIQLMQLVTGCTEAEAKARYNDFYFQTVRPWKHSQNDGELKLP